jgi:DNA primase
MGKVAPVSAKYIIHATIEVTGVVDKPDVIGAVFGQTEGLLGEDLELRELQKGGRIGRIDVELKARGGKTRGVIVIPSSLDKAETAIVGAAVETIDRIGPCDAIVKVDKIEDVRLSKRDYVMGRAKELLKTIIDEQTPDSREMSDNVKSSVRKMEIVEYGPEKLPAGPDIFDSEEIIIVEGRADVLNLLKNGFKNVIAINGTNIPRSITDICRNKRVILFVDGDRGGDLIARELRNFVKIDSIVRAPKGKEVEELNKKEIHLCLRAKRMSEEEEPSPLRKLLDEVAGTKGAYLLGKDDEILGKVPLSELENTLRGVDSVKTLVIDGVINRKIVSIAEKKSVEYLVGIEARARSRKMKIITRNNIK